MKRPFAYITTAWGRNEYENSENLRRYSRAIYDAGYCPICPRALQSLYLRDTIPQEHRDAQEMARDWLSRSRVLVVCGSIVDESVKNDIAIAQRLRITATTLDGILTVKGHGKRD